MTNEQVGKCPRALKRRGGIVVALAVGLATTGVHPALAQPAPEAEPSPAPLAGFVRVTQTDDGNSLRLEVASKRYTRKGERGPDLRMTGAVHIGDPSFYADIQTLMDTQDVVLFESVKPSGLGQETGDESDEQRAKTTERRIRLLALAIERRRAATDEIPADLGAVEQGFDDRFGRIIAGARADGWGNPIEMERAGAGFDLLSLGADAAPGGEGVNADLRFSSQKPLSATEKGEGGPGIQKQLAESLGLVFQPEAMNEGGPNWRNSDMSVDQVQERLEAAGAGGDQLFRMLSGESFGAKLAGFILRLATGNERSRAMMKVMMIEMLGAADELLASGMGGMAGGERLMKVLIDDRNEVVIKDLEAIIRNEPKVQTVGILYGAGHLADLEKRIGAMGYELAEETWFPAITVDFAASGLTPDEAAAMRNMMRMAIERQRPKPAKGN